MAIKGLILDLDGTVYLGETALPKVVDTLAALRRDGLRALFVSNKPLESRQAYAEKLSRLGIPAVEDDILTSAVVLGGYLSRAQPDLRFYVVGEENFKNELRRFGLTVLPEFLDQDAREVIDPGGTDAVIVAFDRSLDYRKLNTAYQALLRGAAYYATNADTACPMPSGAIPDAGATLAALEQLTGRRPDLVAGKPSQLILNEALARLNISAQECLMVGDRLETDIRMGLQAGMRTALALTGVTRRQDLDTSPILPDFVLESFADLTSIVALLAGR